MLQSCDLNVPVGETVSFWAAVGGSGQLQLLPLDSELSKLRDSFRDTSKAGPDWKAAGDAETQIHRQLQSFLRVSCHAKSQSGKVSITFHVEATKQGYLTAPSTVIVLTTGKVFEVWSKENWQRFSRIVDLRQLAEDADELFRERQ